MNTTVKANVATLLAAPDIFAAAFKPLESLEGMTGAFTLQAYPTSLLQKCNDSLRLDTEKGTLMHLLLSTRWNDDEDDNVVIKTSQTALREMDRVAASRGTTVPYRSMSYAYSFQHPIASYGSANHGNLRTVSKAYDPIGLFQTGVPEGFKLRLTI
jgi:hypothetical protein